MARLRVPGMALALLAGVGGCGWPGRERVPDSDALRLSFEDRPEPDVFLHEGPAQRDAPGGAPGLWATVPDLPQPERALVVNLGNRRKVAVSLFQARRGGATTLSGEAADALGVADVPASVRITALRSEPRLGTTTGRF
jgi:hypothetical protein